MDIRTSSFISICKQEEKVFGPFFGPCKQAGETILKLLVIEAFRFPYIKKNTREVKSAISALIKLLSLKNVIVLYFLREILYFAVALVAGSHEPNHDEPRTKEVPTTCQNVEL